MALTQIELGMLKDGILTADTAGRLKMADGFLTLAKLSATGTPDATKFLRGDNSWQTVIQKIIQVQVATTTTVTSIGAETEGTIVNVSITPTSSSSQILLWGQYSYGWTSGSPNTTMSFIRTIGGTTTYPGRFQDGARIGGVCGSQIPSGSEDMQNNQGFFLDSPATTSAITYGTRYTVYDGAIMLNRVGATSDAVWASRTYSTIMAIEVSA
jgi:hypothetical protein